MYSHFRRKVDVDMSRPKKFGIFLIETVIVHVILLYSIFDIYFTSPVLHGMREHSPHINQEHIPAKRLVLFIADGLRYDKCFEETEGEVNMPFLRYNRLHLLVIASLHPTCFYVPLLVHADRR